MRGKRTRGQRRQETPQEAWERMRGGNRQQGGARQSSPPPDPQPVYEQRTIQTAPSGQRPEGNGAHRWEGPPPAEPEQPSRPDQSDPKDAPVGELVKQLTDQTKTLVKQEMRLAQVELQEKGKKMGVGAGLFGAGGLVGFFGGALLIVAIVLALDTALPAWLAALIVAVVLLAGAGIAALLGKKQIEKATPPAPEAAMESVKKDVDTVKEAARS